MRTPPIFPPNTSQYQMPFFYASLSLIWTYYLVDEKLVAPYLKDTRLRAARFSDSQAKGKALIAETDAQIAAQLKPVQGKPFVVFHDAYGYFAAHYGVTVAGAVALGDATSPGAAHLRDLQGKAGAEALCLFPEAGHDSKQVEQMAEATGVKLGAALDPEGAALERDALIYPALLQGLAKTLADCLSQK